MYVFSVIPESLQNIDLLYYTYHLPLKPGTIVEIKLRNKIVYGVIIMQISDQDSGLIIDKIQIKSIERHFNKQLTSYQLKLIFSISNNFFTNINALLKNFIQPFELLINTKTKNNQSKDEQSNIIPNDNLNSKNKLTPLNEIIPNESIEINQAVLQQIASNSTKRVIGLDESFINNDKLIDINIRIINLIRSYIVEYKEVFKQTISKQFKILEPNFQKQNKNSTLDSAKWEVDCNVFDINILIIFPEGKLLSRIYSALRNDIQNLLQDNYKVNEFLYTGDKSKNSKSAVSNIISSKLSINQEVNLYYTGRSGIFLPFNHLNLVILVDESNNLYIQDQNSIYYDTREIVYYLKQIYMSELYFVSNFISARFYNYLKNKENIKSKTNYNNLQVLTNKFEPFAKSNQLYSYQTKSLLDESFKIDLP
jgi:primosomal protein N'